MVGKNYITIAVKSVDEDEGGIGWWGEDNTF